MTGPSHFVVVKIQLRLYRLILTSVRHLLTVWFTINVGPLITDLIDNIQTTLKNLVVLMRPVRICDILFNLRIVQMFLYLLTY